MKRIVASVLTLAALLVALSGPSGAALAFVVESSSTITVTKVVVNDDCGTADVSNFTLYVGGQEVTSGEATSFEPGEYDVTEDGPSGYTASFSGDCDTSGHVVLGEDEQLCITITNDDEPCPPATLIVCKTVINNDGGQAVVSDFTFVILDDGGEEVDSAIPESAGNNCVTFMLPAGSYTITEEGPNGYAPEFSGDSTDGDLTLLPGDEKQVIVTNDDFDPTITVCKVVVNNDGGDATSADWAIVLSTPEGTEVERKTPQSNQENCVQFVVEAGDYIITEESGPAGYEASFSGDCDVDGNISVVLGDAKDVTITNDDQPCYIVLAKTVVNDDGGTLGEDDFRAFIDGEPAEWGQNQVAPGTHAVSEETQEDYVASDWSGDCEPDGSNVSVSLGETKTCAITNDDSPLYRITGHKYCCDEEGCTDTGIEGWEIVLVGPVESVPPAQQTTTTDGNGYYEFIDLVAGTYIVSETLPEGWDTCTLEETTVVVGPGKGVTYSTPDLTEYYDEGSATWLAAAEAWEHGSWGSAKSQFASDADWVWTSYRVSEPVDGEVADFRHEFIVPGTPANGELFITVDNGYEAYLNGAFVGSAQVTDFDGTDWQDSLLYHSWVDGQNWQSVETWDVSGMLVSGVNTLILETANEYMGPDDSPSQSAGTISSNPAGVIFELTYAIEPSEEYVVDFCNYPDASAESNSPVCEESTIELTGGPDGMAEYSWTGPEDFTSDEQSPEIPNATEAMSGTYELTVTTEEGCSWTSSVDVVVMPPCTVDARDVTICSTYLTESADDLDFDCEDGCCEPTITIDGVPIDNFGWLAGSYSYTVSCGCPDSPCEPAEDSASLTIVDPCTVDARDVVVCSSPCAHPKLENGGFEEPIIAVPWDIVDSGTSGLGWTVEWYGGSTSYKGQARPEPAHLEFRTAGSVDGPYSGDQFVELDTDWDGPGNGLNGEPGSVRIYQDINTCPGNTYTIEYAWAPRPGNNNNVMEVYWDGILVDTHSASGNGHSTVQWTLEQQTGLEASGDTTTRLEFIETGTSNALGMFLDAVSVTGEFALIEEDFDFDCENGCCEPTITISVDSVDVPLEEFIAEAGEYTYTVTCGCPDGPCEPVTDTATLTVVNPCVASAPDFSVCQDLELDDDLFIEKGAGCSGAECCGIDIDHTGVSTDTPGSYDYTVTCGCPDGPCPPNTATGTVTVNTLPTVDAGSDQEICDDAGDLTLTGGTPAGGSWSGTHVSGGLFDSDAATPGDYTVTYSYTDPDTGCSNSDTKTVTVFPLPEAGFAAGPVCLGTPTEFTDQSTAPGDASVTEWAWDFDDDGFTDSTVQNPTHTFSTAGNHTVSLSVVDSNGCTDDVEQTVVVYNLPTADFFANTVCLGTPTTFTDSSTQGDSPIVSWDWDFGDGGTGTDQNPSHVFTTWGTHTVTLTVTDEHGCVDSIQKDVTVYPVPIVALDDMEICGNAFPVDLVADTTGSECDVISYQWYLVEGAIETLIGENGPTYTLDGLEAGTYTYAVVVMCETQCSARDEATVIVLAAPEADAGPNEQIQRGNSVQIGGSPTAAGGVPGYTYSWTPTASLSNPSAANPTASPDSTTTYTVLVTDTNGCTDEDSVTIVVTSPPSGGGGGTIESEPICWFDVDMLGEVTRIYVTCQDGRCLADYEPEDPDDKHFLDFIKGTRVTYERDEQFNGGPPRWIRMRVSEDEFPLPEDTELIGDVYTFIGYTATGREVTTVMFDREVGMELDYDPDDLPDNARSVGIALWDADKEEWQVQKESTKSGRVAGVGTATADVSHFSTFAVLATTGDAVEEPPAPAPTPTPPSSPVSARFSASALVVDPAIEKLWGPLPLVTVDGRDVTVTATVTNLGEEAGTYTAELSLNGEVVGNQEVTLEAGEERLVRFQIANVAAGNYSIELGGMTGQFTSSRTVNWWILGSIIGIGVVTVVVLLDRERRRRRIA